MNKTFAAIFLVFGFTSLLNDVFAQNDTSQPSVNIERPVYKVNKGTTAAISLIGTATNLWAIPNIIHNKRGLSDLELDALQDQKKALNSFDRWALDLNPGNRDAFYKASDFTLPAFVAASGISLLFDKKIKKDWVNVLLMYYEMHAITFNLYNFSFFGPNFQNRIRPFSYYNYFPREERKTGNQRNSMYSGHTANTAAATFFAVKVYSDYHPEIGKKKYLFYALASVPPLLEGYLRVKALAHFPSDNLIGFGIGAAMGIIIPELHRINYRNIQVGINTSSTTPELALRWTPEAGGKRLLPTFMD